MGNNKIPFYLFKPLANSRLRLYTAYHIELLQGVPCKLLNPRGITEKPTKSA
jgi:hypothetical protein